MQYFPRKKAALALVVLSLILLAFMLLVTTNTITNISGVETEGVSAYWDISCTNRTLLINWGTLTPGSVKSIVIYVRNEGNEPIYLIMSTTKWNPSKASDYITVRWDYAGRRIYPDEVLQISLVLSISRRIEGISNFGFDIVIAGSQNLPGDVNGDGKITSTDVTILNSILVKLMLELMTMEEALAQYPSADLDGDGMVISTDLTCLYSIQSKIMLGL